MRGTFKRKPNTIDELIAVKYRNNTKCATIKVVAEVILTKEEFETFSQNLLAVYDFIAKHTNETGVESDGTMRCILVKGEHIKDRAIAVESEGYDYARYAALVTA